jgi:ATP-dependent helicase HrpB
VIEAPPGAGKTTRVPPALLDIVEGEVVVLEPRRIAARLAARRVASELGEQAGETVGYQVRFEEAVGPRTRLRFVTEGILTRRLLSDPGLKGVDAVVLDEFHERHLDSDLALALLKRLQRIRPELRIVVMSATLNAAPVARYLDDCPAIRSEGRLFELAIRHLPYSSAPLHEQVRNSAEMLLRETTAGHTLVFLPGIAEIRRAIRECESLARKYELLLLPLHGDLSPVEQDRAIAPSVQRKVIFATNVAESSVTVEGVSGVIDSGLARFASYSPWTGLPTLHIGRVSKASATQRAGRAGRTGPGRVLRLYPEEDFAQRPDHDVPEILRSDLSQLCLALRSMGVGHIGELDWLDTPPDTAVQAAEGLLDRLGAIGEAAKELARFPLPPRLSKLLVESKARGAGEEGCIAAALLSLGARSEVHDLLAAVEAPQDTRTQQHVAQLRRLVRSGAAGRCSQESDEALLMSVLAAFPDRVARRRAETQVLLSSGGSAELIAGTPPYEFMVAVDIEDRKEKPLPLIRMTSRIEPEWLIDLFPEQVRDETTIVWNREAERVDAASALRYDDLVLQESRNAQPDPVAAAEMLTRKALEGGIGRFIDEEALCDFEARVEFAGLDLPDIPATFAEVCTGLRSFAELRNAATNFLPLLESKVSARTLGDNAPQGIRLHGGRVTKVHYEHDKAPWIASRLQDFFGMHETPRIGPQRIPVVIHLLAPNRRAVQTTTDLPGFWQRLYPEVRRELMRRYPRHAWPERP